MLVNGPSLKDSTNNCQHKIQIPQTIALSFPPKINNKLEFGSIHQKYIEYWI